ncbi:MAG: hypothetical protein V4525_13520 [Pseudomonadota bacterium]
MAKLTSFETENPNYEPLFLDNDLFRDPYDSYDSYEENQNFAVNFDSASDDEQMELGFIHYEVDSLI